LERLVEEAHQGEIAKEAWDEKTYTDSRFNERIQILENAGHVIIPEILKDLDSLKFEDNRKTSIPGSKSMYSPQFLVYLSGFLQSVT
jgi:hypothetical protein